MKTNYVIADDLTGAAEIAGIAYSRGVSVEVLTGEFVNHDSDKELVIINSDSRNLPPQKAAEIIHKILETCNPSKDSFIFKKTDSLLRGNIETEISAIFSSSNYKSSILIPANPSRNRCIKEGKYLIGNIPVNHTVYRLDPEYPRESADVKKLIHDATDNIVVGTEQNRRDEGSILIPDVTSTGDIKKLLRNGIHADILPAGGADFFKEFLNLKYSNLAKGENQIPSAAYKCYIIGSYSQVSRLNTEEFQRSGYKIMKIQVPEIFKSGKSNSWRRKVLNLVQKKSRIVLTVPDEFVDDLKLQDSMVIFFGNIAADIAIMEKNPVHFLITGGRTASAFCNTMKWSRLSVIHFWENGIISLKSPDSFHFMTIKPGTYPWPDLLLK